MSTVRFAALALLGVTLIAAGPPQSARAKSKGSAMTAGIACKNDALHRSRCMIELILDDLGKTLGTVAGGGISQIKAATSTSYAVSLPQEGRVDLVTYEFDVKDGTVAIKGKTASTKSH